MIDQLRALRDQIDAAISALEPLEGVLAAWSSNQEPQESREAVPATTMPENGSSPPDAPWTRRCVVCGEPFPARPKKRFCGDGCRKVAWQRMQEGKTAARAVNVEQLAPLPDVTERDHRVPPETTGSDPMALRPPPLPWEQNGAAP